MLCLGQENAAKGPGLHLDRNVAGDDRLASITGPNSESSDSSSSDSSDSDVATGLDAQGQGGQPLSTSVAPMSGGADQKSTAAPDGVAADLAAPDASPMSAAQQRATVQNLRQSMGLAGDNMHPVAHPVAVATMHRTHFFPEQTQNVLIVYS